MRQYRGLTKDGKWAYGWYLGKELRNSKPDKVAFIVDNIGICLDIGYPTEITDFHAIEVIPSTVGQFTGLKDQNGVEIYEGDIVNNANGFSYIVKWGPSLKTNNPKYTGWVMRAPDIKGSDFGANELFEWSKGNIEVIGTIHQSPELLEQSHD